MRKSRALIIRLTILSLLWPATAIVGENPLLKWKKFNDGLAEAKKFDKKILVDVYTDWCGWCKKMDKEVYAEKKVAEYLSKRFVVIKLNAESEAKLTYRGQTITQTELSQAFGVQGYPATIFMKPNSDPITLLPGYMPAENFIDVLKFIAEDHYLTMKWDEYQSKKN